MFHIMIQNRDFSPLMLRVLPQALLQSVHIAAICLLVLLTVGAPQTQARIYPVRSVGASSTGTPSTGASFKWGFINRAGKMVVPFKLDEIGFRGENFVAARVARQWGFLDERTGNWAIPPRYEGADTFSDGLAAAKTKGKWGYVNARGEWKISPRFVGSNDAYGLGAGPMTFSEGLAAVEISLAEADKAKWPGQSGYIDKTGKWVITPRFSHVEPFRNGYARVNVVNVAKDFDVFEAFTNRQGQLITAPKGQEWLETYDFYEGLAAVKVKMPSGALFGFIDTTGKMVIPPRFLEVFGATPDESSGGFRDGVALVVSGTTKENLRIGWIDKTGQWAIDAKFNGGGLSFVEGLAPVREGTEPGKGIGGYVDRSGAYIVAPQFEKMGFFSDGVAPVQKPGEKWGYIDRTGKFVVPARFDYVPMEKAPSLEFMALQFHDGLAWVSENGVHGYIDIQGRWVWKTLQKS